MATFVLLGKHSPEGLKETSAARSIPVSDFDATVGE